MSDKVAIQAINEQHISAFRRNLKQFILYPSASFNLKFNINIHLLNNDHSTPLEIINIGIQCFCKRKIM